MRLVRLQMIGSVVRNEIFSLKWRLLLSEREYFGLFGNTHILFIILLYPIKG